MPLPNRKRWFVAVRYNPTGTDSHRDFDHFGQAVDWVSGDNGAPRTIARTNGKHLVRASQTGQKNLGYVR